MNPTTFVSNVNPDLDLKYNLYGWGHFRCSGILSKPLFAYIVLCICTFIQNFSVNGANNAVISTVERAFYLNSVQSGLFLALYDLATVFSAPLVGYLGSLYSSPIFFSLNMIIVSIGNILIASSNFINENNKLNFNSDFTQNLLISDNVLFQCSNDSLLYQDNITNSICLKDERLSSISTNAKFLLYSGNFINGIGSVALFTIGIVYIERIFPREKAAYCQGIYFAVGTVGGALGIVATGRFLLFYTKLIPKQRLPSWLTPSHPLWIGCWWLPYFIYGSLCFLIGLFVSGLPNYEIPGKKHSTDRNNKIIPTVSAQQQYNHASINRAYSPPVDTMTTTCPSTSTTDNILSESFSDLKNKNPSQLISSATDNNTSNGIINHAFSTDTLYNQLPTTNSVPSATTISENPLVQQQTNNEDLENMCFVISKLMKNMRYIFIIIANLFEGILIKGFVPFITKYFEYQHQLDTSTATLITGAIALLSVIIGCPIGAYFINKFSWTPMQCARICTIILTISSFLFLFLIFSCPELKFQHTSCSSMNTLCCQHIYHPVCDINDARKMYLSPCHFGCANQTIIKSSNTFLYSSCNCAEDTIVSETVCRFRRIPCTTMFALTMAGATFVVFFTAFIQVPMLQVLLYSVSPSYQNMALALRQTIVRVLGQTTGPLLFGYVFDQSCLVWLTDCYARRTCKVYNNRRMGLSMALSGFSIRLISGIACAVVYFNWKFIDSNQNDSSLNTQRVIADDPIHYNEDHEITRL
ncbi:unnamed protein product [Rotaria sp. Silwood2]|nr:unnamed protein product [Rotaria sp. Silwood2]CAF2583538.1 unnamed protein product [Rotaria sp. Silwood2]CAF2991350.1 unnamed protein product [Rotaria sp. Silwood2]CAF3867257.1 unnamed protein product [Rotaria sp. Silwood2]CAF3982004.1 unnamed protein product [Rotaria sp. Silwood2]